MLSGTRPLGILLPCLAVVIFLCISGCGSIDEKRTAAESQVLTMVSERDLPAPVFDQELRKAELQALMGRLLSEELNEDDALRLAVLNSPRLQARFEVLGISSAHLIQAGLLKNPVFVGSMKFSSGAAETELALAQSFLEIFYLPLQKAKARAELDAAIAEVTHDLIGVAFEVRREFWRNRLALLNVELQTEIEEGASTAFDLMARLHQAGNVSDFELSIQEVALTQARLDLAQAKAKAMDVREPLNIVLGLWGQKTNWRIQATKPETATSTSIGESDESRAIAASLDLAINRAHANEKAQMAGLKSWVSIFPELELGPTATGTEEGVWSVGPEIALAIPLFDQGQAQSALASAELQMIMHQHVALAVEIRATLRRFRERLLALENQSEYYRTVHLPAQKRLLIAVLKNYNAMQVGAFDVLKAKRAEMSAQREYLDVQVKTQLARLDYEEILLGRLNHERASAEMMRSSGAPPMEDSGGH